MLFLDSSVCNHFFSYLKSDVCLSDEREALFFPAGVGGSYRVNFSSSSIQPVNYEDDIMPKYMDLLPVPVAARPKA